MDNISKVLTPEKSVPTLKTTLAGVSKECYRGEVNANLIARWQSMEFKFRGPASPSVLLGQLKSHRSCNRWLILSAAKRCLKTLMFFGVDCYTISLTMCDWNLHRLQSAIKSLLVTSLALRQTERCSRARLAACDIAIFV